LYTRCPKPIRRTPLALSLAASMKREPSSPERWISSSISMTAWFAPPWSGPQRAQTPAETEAKRLAPPEATMRTVEVEQFCSWSAWSSRMRSSALATSGWISQSALGWENIRWRKLPQ